MHTNRQFHKLLFLDALILWAVVCELQPNYLNIFNTVTRRMASAAEVLAVLATCTCMVFSASRHMRCVIASLSQAQEVGQLLVAYRD